MTGATLFEGSTIPPKSRRRIEAADIVIACSIGLVVLIVGIFVVLCFQGYDTTISTSEKRAQTAANIVGDETQWVISSARAVLEGLAATATGGPNVVDPSALAAFRASAGQLPEALGLAVFDASGAPVGTSETAGTLPNIADRDYFQQLAAGADWSLSRQVADPRNGDAAFIVARRVVSDGAFSGVVAVMLRASVLIRFATAQELGEGSTVSIVRDDGWVIARDPSLSAPLNLQGTPAFTSLTASPSGSYISAASPADGIARIVAFRHVEGLGYIAVASVSMTTALAGLWNAIIIVSLLLAPIAATVLIGSFVTARLLRRTQATSRSLAAALEQNETLFREIHHRVKNNLESVNALLRLQKIDPATRDELSRRLFAVSSIHEHIYRSSSFAEVRARNYLHGLIENIRASYDPTIEVVEDIDDISVNSDAATPLGLIVNEVVSNSFKHAFPDGRRGRIDVSLKPEGAGQARLTVRDDGVGLDPDAPASGIGRRLVKGFAQQLQGTSTHTGSSGSEFVLIFPLGR